ncbi:MAG TPA: Gfo/Idh/MocA family oxidoreductase [Candidatus Binatia bacterium]|nr:Gfo/Idh/MocA family oxidoreductase [Candidatus Binatia bacterium]
MAASERVLGVGVIGLGGASLAMIPKFVRNPNFRIAAAADIDAEIMNRFRNDFPDAEFYDDAARLCASRSVDLVYIATPNRCHAEHARVALESKKHVLIEKPMTIDIVGAEQMIATAKRNGVLLGVNVKHSFEPRVLRLREIARSGELGKLRMINSWRFVDWLYRPRTAEELTPEFGGGILWRQGAHHFDYIRTIAGGMVRSVRGNADVWDATRRVSGCYSAYLDFEDGTVASAVCSGYDHFDSMELVQRGFSVDPANHARARRELRAAPDADWEERAAREERYGGARMSSNAPEPARPSLGWIMGGPLIASFDKGDVRMTPGGLTVYADDELYEIKLGVKGEDGRDGRINTFYDAIVRGRALPADGTWGMATLEVILAIEESGRTRKEAYLRHQVPTIN